MTTKAGHSWPAFVVMILFWFYFSKWPAFVVMILFLYYFSKWPAFIVMILFWFHFLVSDQRLQSWYYFGFILIDYQTEF